MNVHPLVPRLIDLHRAEFLTRLLPHVRDALVEKRKSIEKAEKAAIVKAKADKLPPAILNRIPGGHRRIRPLHMANAILEDSVCAVAFGYRLDRAARQGMIENVVEGTWEFPRDRAGVPLHTLVLRRADLYLRMIDRIVDDLGYASNVKRAIKDTLEAVQFALLPDAPDNYPPSDGERPRRRIEIVRWSVEHAVGSILVPTRLTAEQRCLIEDALHNSHRTLVDTKVEAATALLREDEPPSDNARGWLCRYLIDQTQKHAKSPDHMSDSMTFFWALEALSAAGETREAAEVLETFRLAIKKIGAEKDDDLLRQFLRRRTYRPTTQELPEIGENTRRGSCRAMVSLCKLRRDFVRAGIKVGLPTIDLLLEHYIGHIVQKSCHEDTDKKLYAGMLPAPANMYVIALHLWALESWSKSKSRRKARPFSVATKLVSKSRSLEDTVRYATEINLEDHRLFGDFLVWNGSHERLTNMKKDLIDAVEHYFDSASPRPLNVLIAAEPGTGKSFFVKNALKGTTALERLSLIEINATQLQRAGDLFGRLRLATSQIAEHGKGLLFLDEADALLADGEYLFSHLLGPMWDGEYATDGVTLAMKRVVWFFAVSRASTYDKFAARLKREKIAKAQDFLSRLYLKFDLPKLGVMFQDVVP